MAAYASSSISASSGRRLPPPMPKIVGQDEERAIVRAKLFEEEESLKIISITGLPGIGKSILARSIYEDPEVEMSFRTHAWVTVSHESQLSDIFTELLNSMYTIIAGQMEEAGGGTTSSSSSVDQLRNELRRKLSVAKYLVVVDDMSDQGIWDEVKKCLPDEKNGSRVILTTRFAIERGFRCVVQPLWEDDSWILLSDRAFGGGPGLDHLEETGMLIAKNCGGIPLLLTAIGDLLFRERKTEEFWEFIRDKTYAAKGEEEEELGSSSYSEILSLSCT